MSYETDINRIGVRRALEAKEKFVVAPVFPSYSLHLIVGDSSMGKSTWALDMLHDWEQGKAVLGGLISHPCPWVYVSLDRSLQDTNRTLRRIGLGDWNIPAFSIEEICKRDAQTNQLIAPSLISIHERFQWAEMIFLEGLQPLLPNTGRGQSQNKAETLWIMEARDKVLNNGITVFASEHIAKGTDMSAMRTRRNSALGSASLMGGAGTIVSFDYTDEAKAAKTPDPAHQDRVVHFSGHNFAPYSLGYERDDVGRFILNASKLANAPGETYDTDSDKFFMLNNQLSAWPADQELSSIIIDQWAGGCGFGVPMRNKWLRQQLNTGILTQTGLGKYRKGKL